MMSASPLALSLTDAGSLAGIVSTAVTVILLVVGFLRPTRKFLSRFRLFSSWILTKKEREQIRTAVAKAEADKRRAEAAKRADLQFELRQDGGIKLITHNKGLCSAQHVVIYGLLSPKYWGYDSETNKAITYGRVAGYENIPPKGSRSVSVSNVENQIEYGASQWSLTVDWDDEAGEHRGEESQATRWG